MLNLEILAGQIDNLAVIIVLHQITGSVYGFRHAEIQRILHESFPGLLGIVIVSHGKRSSPDTQLPYFIARYRLILVIQYQNIRIGHRNTDRKRLIVGKFTLHNIISAGIRIQNIRQELPPYIKLLVGHNLTTEKYPLQGIRQVHVAERFQFRHHNQCRRHPENRINLLFLQILQQRHRLGKQVLRDNIGRRPTLYSTVDIKNGIVKIKRRLISETVLLRNLKSLRHPVNIINYRTVVDGDAFGHTCGTGSKQYIQ